MCFISTTLWETAGSSDCGALSDKISVSHHPLLSWPTLIGSLSYLLQLGGLCLGRCDHMALYGGN